MANTYRGAVRLRLGEQDCLLVYDWQALARLKTDLGDDVLSRIAGAGDPVLLSRILAIGLARHQPDLDDPPTIMRLSPPYMPCVEAVHRAVNAAYWGPAGPPDEEPPPNPLQRMATRLKRLFAPPSRQG